MLQSPCKLGGSYGSDTERVAQYVMRYATRGMYTCVPIHSQCVKVFCIPTFFELDKILVVQF